jgi:hypothetical protein
MNIKVSSVGTTLTPKITEGYGVLTGCAIIIKHYPVPKYIKARPSMYTSEEYQEFLTTKEAVNYEVLTDFGNKFILTQEELDTNYTAGKIERDIKSRLQIIINNHIKVLAEL